MALFTDGTTSAVERALSAVAERQRVTANNIANSVTPGFRASRVDFEQALGDAVRRGEPGSAGFTVRDAGTPADNRGNTVSMQDETTIMVKSGLQYDALVSALNYKLGLLRSAIEGR
jgi:flagellar basal-body rod protein FlgB